jgi:hypothetical protein
MSYYDNITLGGLGNQETTGSNSEISWGKPVMGSFQSRLENTPSVGSSIIYIPLRIKLPRPSNSTLISSNFDSPYNCVRLNAVIFNKGQVGDDAPPIYIDQEFYFSLAQGANFSYADIMTNFNSAVNSTLYEGILDSNIIDADGSEFIVFGSSKLNFDNANVASITITYTTNANPNTVAFIKGLYLLI